MPRLKAAVAPFHASCILNVGPPTGRSTSTSNPWLACACCEASSSRKHIKILFHQAFILIDISCKYVMAEVGYDVNSVLSMKGRILFRKKMIIVCILNVYTYMWQNSSNVPT